MDDEFRRTRARPTETDARARQQVAFRTGISAESRAAVFLIAKGFRIVARRWKCPLGEIDIIARRRALLVFVEVKARPNLEEAAWSVTEHQRARIVGAAEAGLLATATTASAIFVSTPCWSRPAVCRATSRGHLKPADDGRLVKSRQAAFSLAKN